MYLGQQKQSNLFNNINLKGKNSVSNVKKHKMKNVILHCWDKRVATII